MLNASARVAMASTREESGSHGSVETGTTGGATTSSSSPSRRLANKKTAHPQTPTRAISYYDQRPATIIHPVSILRKPSLPNLNSLADVAAAAVPRLPQTAPIMSSPLCGHAIAFPPLPPLPPFPHASDNVLRKSAPPSTYTSTLASGSQTTRIRPRRSRVSFRDEVDALEEQPRRRPASHGPPSPLPAPIRRPSADAEVAVRKATSVRPVLKRASSSTPLGPLRRASDSTATATTSYDAFDAFRPQTLRYPRVSPALARLSDGGLSLSGAADTWSAGSMQRKQATIAATTSKLTASPSKASSSSDATAVPKDRECERDNRASTQATPSRKARKPRSPIPSWSSTCPSLSSSSHRASVASTLTAPSMTSLLLSPPSPIDRYLPAMPTHTFGEDGLPASPLAAKEGPVDGSLCEMDGGGSGGFSGASAKRSSGGGSYQRDISQGNTSDPHHPRLQAPVRLRPRHSEPASFGSSAPSSYSVPRASERLLRLQNSLADLRMQRRASSKDNSPTMQRHRPKPLVSTGQRDSPRSGQPRSTTPDAPATSDTPSSVRSSFRVSRAPSPTFAELARARPGRERDDADALADSGDESDLDLSLPPLNAALRSRVIPSSSRLLVKMTQPSGAGTTYDDDERDGLGWSGSESEEEEFSRTVARIAKRKSGVAVPRQLSKRPSLPAGYLHRHSDIYGSSLASNQTSPSSASDSQAGGPPTPSVAERPSTSLGTSRPTQGTAALLSALVEQKYASRDTLPRPKRFVHGWGAPEVLLEDDWPPDNLASDDMSISEHSSSTTNVTTPTIAKQAAPASTRLPRPLGTAW